MLTYTYLYIFTNYNNYYKSASHKRTPLKLQCMSVSFWPLNQFVHPPVPVSVTPVNPFTPDKNPADLNIWLLRLAAGGWLLYQEPVMFHA